MLTQKSTSVLPEANAMQSPLYQVAQAPGLQQKLAAEYIFA